MKTFAFVFTRSPGKMPAPQQMKVTAVDEAAGAQLAIGANLVCSEAWFEATPLQGTTDFIVSVKLNTVVKWMLAGTYKGTISVSSPDAINSPQLATVTLTIRRK